MPKVTEGIAKTRAWASVPSPAPGPFHLVTQPEAPNICKTDDSWVETKGKALQKNVLEWDE